MSETIDASVLATQLRLAAGALDGIAGAQISVHDLTPETVKQLGVELGASVRALVLVGEPRDDVLVSLYGSVGGVSVGAYGRRPAEPGDAVLPAWDNAAQRMLTPAEARLRRGLTMGERTSAGPEIDFLEVIR